MFITYLNVVAFYSFAVVFVVCHSKLWRGNSNPCYSVRGNKSSGIWPPNTRIERTNFRAGVQRLQAPCSVCLPLNLWSLTSKYTLSDTKYKADNLQELVEFFSWTGKDSRAKLLDHSLRCQMSLKLYQWIITEIGEPIAACLTQNSLAKPWWEQGSQPLQRNWFSSEEENIARDKSFNSLLGDICWSREVELKWRRKDTKNNKWKLTGTPTRSTKGATYSTASVLLSFGTVHRVQVTEIN